MSQKKSFRYETRYTHYTNTVLLDLTVYVCVFVPFNIKHKLLFIVPLSPDSFNHHQRFSPSHHHHSTIHIH